jgi:hypothetical protein
MVELSGAIKDLSVDFRTGQAVLNLAVNEKQIAMACFDELHGCKKLSIKIGKWREKRSNDANAYLWVLCSKLAEKLSEDGSPHTKEEIYQSAVKARGIYREQGELPLDFAKTSRTAWEMLGTGWVTEQVDFEQDGDRVIVRYYYGTSTYNTKQMSRLIDSVVEDCKAVGIETLPPDKLEIMKEEWHGCIR